MYSFPDLEPVCCSMSSSNCCFLTCIQISLYASDPNVQLKLRPLIYSSREDLNYTPKNVIKSTVRNKSTLKLKRNPKLPTIVKALVQIKHSYCPQRNSWSNGQIRIWNYYNTKQCVLQLCHVQDTMGVEWKKQ